MRCAASREPLEERCSVPGSSCCSDSSWPAASQTPRTVRFTARSVQVAAACWGGSSGGHGQPFFPGFEQCGKGETAAGGIPTHGKSFRLYSLVEQGLIGLHAIFERCRKRVFWR